MRVDVLAPGISLEMKKKVAEEKNMPRNEEIKANL